MTSRNGTLQLFYATIVEPGQTRDGLHMTEEIRRPLEPAAILQVEMKGAEGRAFDILE